MLNAEGPLLFTKTYLLRHIEDATDVLGLDRLQTRPSPERAAVLVAGILAAPDVAAVDALAKFFMPFSLGGGGELPTSVRNAMFLWWG